MSQDLRLVVGASGFLGNILWRRLTPSRCQGTCYSHCLPNLLPLDICHANETSSVIKRLAPSIIFLPAAMPSVDACEINPEKCWAINVEGVSNVIHVAKEIGAKVVFFSTDYVFDGQCGPYSEADEPHPINVYGKAKLFAERVVEETLEDYLIVRVNALYGWELERKNFVMGLIERLSGGQEMRVPVDQVGCPTYAENLVDAILELVDLKQRGILHVAGNCPMNRYEFACTAAEIFGLNKSLLVPIKTPELEQKAPRPLKAGLRIEKAQQILSTRLLGPREGLGLMKREGDPFRRNLGESVTSAD